MYTMVKKRGRNWNVKKEKTIIWVLGRTLSRTRERKKVVGIVGLLYHRLGGNDQTKKI